MLIVKNTLYGGWMGGWMEGWKDGRKSRVKDCLQQSKIVELHSMKVLTLQLESSYSLTCDMTYFMYIQSSTSLYFLKLGQIIKPPSAYYNMHFGSTKMLEEI